MIIRNGSNIFSISDSKLYLIVKIKFYRFANPRTNASKKKNTYVHFYFTAIYDLQPIACCSLLFVVSNQYFISLRKLSKISVL